MTYIFYGEKPIAVGKTKNSGLNFLLRGLISTQISGNIESRGPSYFQKNFRKYQSEDMILPRVRSLSARPSVNI